MAIVTRGLASYQTIVTEGYSQDSFSTSVSITGISATISLSSVVVQASANTNIAGISATISLGSTTESGTANIAIIGISSTSSLGSTIESAAANTSITGVNGITYISSVTVTTGGSTDVNITVSGVHAHTYLSNTSISASSNTIVSGVEAHTYLSNTSISASSNTIVSGVHAHTYLSFGSQSINIDVVGVAATISLSSVIVSASAQPGALSIGGGGGSMIKLDWQKDLCNPKPLGLLAFIKLNSVIISTNGFILETDQEEEEIVMALIASLNMPQAKNADNDMEVFNVIKLINDLLNVKNTKNK